MSNSPRLLIATLALAISACTASQAIVPKMGDSQEQTSAAATHTAGIPVRLSIPSITVDAPIEEAGVTETNEMAVPENTDNVAWYMLGPRPGEQGNAVIAGHLDSKIGPAVFWKLKNLKVGDEIFIYDDASVTHTFRVIKTAIYQADDAPLEEIFGKSDKKHLNLITCGGTWNIGKGRYPERLTVYTEAVDTSR